MGKGGGSKMVETSSDIPDRYRDYVDENLAIAGTIANRGYIPYQGPRIAGFTPDQMASFDAVRGLGSDYQRPLGMAEGAYGTGLNAMNPFMNNANAAFTAGMNSAVDPSVMMAKYQDPYTEQVIDATTNDLNRSFDRSSEQARLSSPFGGDRLALREGTIEGERGRAIADVGSRLRSDGFRTAAGLGQQATNQMFAAGDRAAGLGQNIANTYLGAGDRYSGLAGQGLQLGATYADLMSGIGQQQQGLNQAGYDLNYGDFLDQLNYPLQALSIRQSAMGQTPMGSVGRQPVTSGGGGAGSFLSGAGSLFSGLAALCWTAREAYGADNPKWLRAREWMLTKAPHDLREHYIRVGERVAEKIRNDPDRKAKYREVFDKILEAA
jgi:hypothetical protein